MRNAHRGRRAITLAGLTVAGAVALWGWPLSPVAGGSTSYATGVAPAAAPTAGSASGREPTLAPAPERDEAAPPAGSDLDSHVQAAAPVDRTSRAAVVNAYRRVYLPALHTPIGWTGSIASCQAGSVSSAAQSATLAMVNYFRSMVDLPGVTFDPALSAKSQRAALMMSANNALDHFPPSTWACWSADGAEAAGSSNLALGVGGAAAVDLQVDDPGAGNTAAGHRRWIMYPPTLTMGSGSTSNANSLWVFGARGDRPHTKAVEWPSAGYFPRELEPGGRWSVSIPGADLDGATVRVTGPTGAVLPATVHRPAYGYGDPTLVWDLGRLGEVAGRGDRTYRVDVSGIAGWTSTTHSYRVTLVDASPPVQHAPVGGLDDVVVVGDEVVVRGWAADRNLPAGGLRVRVRTERSPGEWSTVVVAWLPRPGLATFGLPTAAGFEARARFRPGTYRICADALDHTDERQTTTPTWLGCREIVVK